MSGNIDGCVRFFSYVFVKGAGAQTPTACSITVLRANIEQIARSVDTRWGISIKCLDTGEEIAIKATSRWAPWA